MALLEEECNWNQALKEKTLAYFQLVLCFMFEVQEVNSQLPISVSRSATCCSAVATIMVFNPL